MKNLIIYLTSFLINSAIVVAQQQQITPTSPNTAGLQKYIDVPVSNHTGAANFDIPIYVVKEGALSLPISLGYHSGGIKVSELATWVGLGWNLNIGGVVTRQVKHLPDEGISAPQQSRGWYRTGYILPDDIQVGFTNQAADMTKDGSFGFTLDNVWTGESAANGKFDCEPDVFSFNFNGYAGKFVYDDVYERRMAEPDVSKRPVIEPIPHVFPLQDVLIKAQFIGEQSNLSVTGKFSYFTITTADGTKYYFGDYNPEQDPNFVPAVEKTRSHIVGISAFLSQDSPTFESADWIISAWYLVRIESADGKRVIKLKYTQERSGYYELGSQFRKLNEAGICGTDFADPTQSSTYLKLSKIAVKSVRLSQVVTANITVNFTANTLREDLNSDQQYNGNYDGNTEAKRLDAIEIQSNLTASCRKFVFDYGYFQENNVGGPEPLPAFYQTSSGYETNFGFADKKRLKLLSVQEMTCNGSLQIPKYQTLFRR